MRRLAKHTRNDTYTSQRDYQQIDRATSLRLTPTDKGPVSLRLDLPIGGEKGPFAAGGFLRAVTSLALEIALTAGTGTTIMDFPVDSAWRRFGIIVPVHHASDLQLRLDWQDHHFLDVWGLTAGPLDLPPGVAGDDPFSQALAQTHLVPETFYFEHDAALDLAISPESTSFCTENGLSILRKKCAYCGRWLPVDPKRLGSLSFHKHNAKRTKHQNECRACKKWRINDSFNPDRTPDQLHESSVITRERRVFLKDPEILQTIKERTGAGLKAQVWERFDRKCFFCGKHLQLNEVQLDHTRPLAYLWPIDEHATCLCAEHNNAKSDRFPVDFYTTSELEKLSDVCGLSLGELQEKSLNQPQLKRILGDLSTFATQWDVRHFAATAHKIKEIEPRIDLFELLDERDPALYASIKTRLDERPAAIPSVEE
jgi:hypothetical protein